MPSCWCATELCQVFLFSRGKICLAGHVLMFTSPEDPFSALPRLRSRDARSQGLLKGYYRMAGNQVRSYFRLKSLPVEVICG